MKRVVALVVAGLVLATTSPAYAGPIFAEMGDAGQTIGTAQLASDGTGGPLTNITGTIGASGNADVFRIFISNPAAFSATTVGQPGTLSDTQLFLFRDDGTGVYANDDSSGGSRSTLPAGNANGPTTPGFYLLAISGFNTDPSNGAGLIFPQAPFNGVFGPTEAGGGAPFTFFTGDSSAGTYNILLVGVINGVTNVPELTTLAVFGLMGVAGAGYIRRRLKGTPVAA